MKKLMVFTAAATLAVAVSACDRPPDATTTGTGTGGTVGTTGSLDADREFIEEQLAMGTAEIELGRLAQERATHPDVKEFGAMMVREHQETASELKPIAAKAATADSTTARNDARDDSRDKVEELSKLSGREFDKQYIDQMIDDHQQGIDDVEKKAENASNAEVKAWAAKTLPKLRQHLEHAKEIQNRLNTTDDPPSR